MHSLFGRAPILSVAAIVSVAMAAPAHAATEGVTFAKDVAPIFQSKCQGCHRPGGGSPMSLLTYDEARPWARAIKQRVERRQMPPWHLDKTVGIRQYKNDRSLSDAQIDTIVRWVDAGAPLGDPQDTPPPVPWPDDETWAIGAPDLIVTSPAHVVAPHGADWWGDYVVDTGLTADRYIKAVETKPSKAGRQVVHHALTFLAQADDGGSEGSYLSEYAVGKYGDTFPDGAGLLMKAGSMLRFNMHYHAAGEEVTDQTRVGFVFYPEGYTPSHEVANVNVGLLLLDNELDIPANRITTVTTRYRLTRPAKMISFQPHMHMRGKTMKLEAMYPTGEKEVLGAVDRFDFNWQVAYVYADGAAPLLPEGTILQATAVYDNTAENRSNPDPNLWVGFGNRSVDEMFQCHVLVTYLDDTEYRQMVRERAKTRISSASVPHQ